MKINRMLKGRINLKPREQDQANKWSNKYEYEWKRPNVKRSNKYKSEWTKDRIPKGRINLSSNSAFIHSNLNLFDLIAFGLISTRSYNYLTSTHDQRPSLGSLKLVDKIKKHKKDKENNWSLTCYIFVFLLIFSNITLIALTRPLVIVIFVSLKLILVFYRH